MNILTFPVSFLRSFKEEWLLFLYLNYPFIDRFGYPQRSNRDPRVPMGTRFYTLRLQNPRLLAFSSDARYVR